MSKAERIHSCIGYSSFWNVHTLDRNTLNSFQSIDIAIPFEALRPYFWEVLS